MLSPVRLRASRARHTGAAVVPALGLVEHAEAVHAGGFRVLGPEGSLAGLEGAKHSVSDLSYRPWCVVNPGEIVPPSVRVFGCSGPSSLAGLENATVRRSTSSYRPWDSKSTPRSLTLVVWGALAKVRSLASRPAVQRLASSYRRDS